MSYIVPTLALLVVTTVTASPLLGALNNPTALLSSELATVTYPVEKSAFSGFSSICTPLKELLHADYNQTEPPDLSKLTLDHYTRDNLTVYKLSEAAELIPASPFFRNQSKIIVYMHGFTGDPSKPTFQDINDAFLEDGDYNVLALDSSSLLGLSTLYIGATTNVRYIGEKLGAVLANMTKVGSSPKSMYLIGHSLGGHIAGFTGKTFTAKTGMLVGRITGLDPAGPCYTTIDDNLKLKSTDAEFVDVMHTNGGVYGLDEQLGHVNFYPNSGSVQPNCTIQLCSHMRAFELYAETVVMKQSMPGVACNSWDDFKNGKCNYSDTSLMGYSCDPSARGRYYLQTDGSSPYGLGTAGLNFDNNYGVIRNVGSATGVVP